jgi:hypothetical protein
VRAKGFTLVEVLTSIFIVLVAVIGIGALMAVGYRDGRTADERNAAAEVGEDALKDARAVSAADAAANALKWETWRLAGAQGDAPLDGWISAPPPPVDTAWFRAGYRAQFSFEKDPRWAADADFADMYEVRIRVSKTTDAGNRPIGWFSTLMWKKQAP